MRKWCLCIACLGALLVACKKTPAEVPKHPYTQEELVKAHLDDSFSAFITALDLDSTAVKRPERFVLENSSVSLDLLGENPAVVYRLKRHGESMLVVRYYWRLGVVKASLYGGIAIQGPILPPDLRVYDQGSEVAKLEMDTGLACLVFRFPDGTAYALNSLLITDALVDFLIKNVLSTE